MMMIRSRRKFLFASLTVAVVLALGAGTIALFSAMGWVRLGFVERWRGDREFTVARSRARRVLVLGDSFLTGWPIEHSLHSDLARWAESNNVGLVNASNAGFGPYEHLDRMREIGPEFRPGLVLLFYYFGNDLTDVLYRPEATPRKPDQPAFRVRQRPEPSTSEGERGTGEDSAATIPQALFRALAGALTSTAHAGPAGGEDPFDWNAMTEHGISPELIEKAKNRIREPNSIGPDYVNPWLLQLALGAPRYLADNVLMDTDACMNAWRIAVDQLAGVAELCDELGAELVVIGIPSTVQVDRSHFDFYRAGTFEVNEGLVTSDRPQELMVEFCDSRGVRMIDFLPRFRQDLGRGGLYWENDDHLSEAGHVLAFEILGEEVLAGWLAEHPPGSESD